MPAPAKKKELNSTRLGCSGDEQNIKYQIYIQVTHRITPEGYEGAAVLNENENPTIATTYYY